MLVLVYRKCSTCIKALNWLEANNIEFEERPIKEQNPTYEELKAWYQMSGMPLKKFFNTSGLIYKDMQLKDKLPTMSEDEQLQLLATNGMLVKRPLVVGENFVLTGFREKEWEERLKQETIYGIKRSIIDYAEAFDCVDHSKLWKFLKAMGIPVHLICLLRNLYQVRKQQLELDLEQQTGSKLEKENIKAVYCHPAYLTYMQSTS